MSELNTAILIENIRSLKERDSLTQKQLADIAGMTQANISKALNPDDKRCFTLEQVYRIATYFRVSLDELTGNKTTSGTSSSPRSVLRYLLELLRSNKAKVIKWTNMEEVFDVEFDWDGPSCDHSHREIEYPAIYFPSYVPFSCEDLGTDEAQALFAEYTQCGNHTGYRDMNEIILKMLPMIELYKNKEIPDEAFQMIVEGYLRQVGDY